MAKKPKKKAAKATKKVSGKKKAVKAGPVHIVSIQDISGSMGGSEKDVIGGFNKFLAEQQALKGEAYLTLVQFDGEYLVKLNRVPLQSVKPMTAEDYQVRGSTALFDAIGKTINSVTDERAIFNIQTDGGENASREFSAAMVKDLIAKKEKDGWAFIFMGADLDAFQAAGSFGTQASANFKIASVSKGAFGQAAAATMTSHLTANYRGYSNSGADAKFVGEAVGATMLNAVDANTLYGDIVDEEKKKAATTK